MRSGETDPHPAEASSAAPSEVVLTDATAAGSPVGGASSVAEVVVEPALPDDLDPDRPLDATTRVALTSTPGAAVTGSGAASSRASLVSTTVSGASRPSIPGSASSGPGSSSAAAS